MLSNVAKDFLLQSQNHPGWIEIQKEIENISKMPKYNPNSDKENQDINWIFHSGRFKENDRILQILKGTNYEPDRGK